MSSIKKNIAYCCSDSAAAAQLLALSSARARGESRVEVGTFAPLNASARHWYVVCWRMQVLSWINSPHVACVVFGKPFCS
jgi:hypothetical protein